MKKGTVCIISGLLLIAAALILTGYNVWDNYRAGKAAEDVLSRLVPLIEQDPIPPEGRKVPDESGTSPSNEIEYPDYVLDPYKEMPVKQVDGNDYVGIISIPAIDRELPVFSDWDYTKMRTAPCRYSGTAYLDDLVICAHNYVIHFGPLRDLSYGDTVTFTDMDGNVFNYKVIEIETLQPTAIEEMTVGDWDLTLFTCTLSGTTRIAVRCERV